MDVNNLLSTSEIGFLKPTGNFDPSKNDFSSDKKMPESTTTSTAD
jgi:hypothetical protein